MTNPGTATDVNLAWWNERANVHGDDGYYDLAGFIAGGCPLREIELELLPDVTGVDLLHLQCHIGLDTLAWARRGATVTGVDFSPVALTRARELTEACSLLGEFIQADTTRLPPELTERFDIAYASYGVIGWIADLAAWMAGAYRALRPGGRLVLIDFHPAARMFSAEDPPIANKPYGGAAARSATFRGSYTGAPMVTSANDVVQYAHSLGEIVTAAAGTGLVVTSLTEYDDVDRDDRGVLRRDSDGRFRRPLGEQFLPVMFSLDAQKPR